LSESVSLHINENKKRVCSHAIYLDRNYNAAQYVQSMDRIHRVGMDHTDDSSFTIEVEDSGKTKEKTFRRDEVYYHFIIANNTIDEDIDDKLRIKFEKMNAALNDDWPLTLDYDGNSVKISSNSAKNDLISLVSNLKNSVERNNGN
jgi:SNF2 family DNA or RNA helicase